MHKYHYCILRKLIVASYKDDCECLLLFSTGHTLGLFDI